MHIIAKNTASTLPNQQAPFRQNLGSSSTLDRRSLSCIVDLPVLNPERTFHELSRHSQ